MKKVTVNASKKYDILIEKGLIEKVGEHMAQFDKVKSVCLVSDDKVFSLYGEKCKKSLEDQGFFVCTFVFENGEKSKNETVLFELLNTLAENKITRTDMLIALGGGVVGDLCGFAAAIYLRGVKFVQIPTTLLAMVDSSVGGKTAIDIPAGKNLVGAFHQPSLVLCDWSALSTLDNDIFRDGCAEVIKYGVILDKAFFELLKTPITKDSDGIEDVIYRSVSIKRDVVEADEFDTGLRQLLNFGHTLGHAIEKLSNFELSHGVCVAKGSYLAAVLGKAMGYRDFVCEIKTVLEDYGFDLSCPFAAKDIASAALSDKKRTGDSITLVIPKEIGECVLEKMQVDRLVKIIEEIV